MIKDINLINNLKFSDTETIDIKLLCCFLWESQVTVALKVLNVLREHEMVVFCILLNT
mgnify:FL=1